MRIFNLITLLCFLMILPFTVTAQETLDAPTSPPPSSDTVKSDSEKKENIFSQASSVQLNEAQRFYKYCINNEVLSKKKNCKCAATSYLATRIKLGDSASVKEIMNKNINSCLVNKEDKAEKITDLSNVTDAQLDEAEQAYNRCKSDPKVSRNIDCECFGARYLDKRLELGPIPSYDQIFLHLRNECKNVVETTGYEYTQCMNYTRYSPPNNIEPKDYCECFARKWGALFSAYKGKVNVSAKNKMRSMATAFCLQPQAYEDTNSEQ